ncbi:MAG: amidase family protein [Clostridia bacterium]|nr:amidase family protein [Clostridia bacterium]
MHDMIQSLHRMYRDQQTTVRKVAIKYITRIMETDQREGGLRSVLEINPDVLFIADALDKNRGKIMPPLYGIPILLKDNINTGDKTRTSAGSVALADNYARHDAHIVTRLRQAGALLLGKANMTEFANYMTREGMPSGYSSRGGQVVNPYNREKTPSGSSSGSAVAVAAGLCAAAIGTETCGSILSPAGANGIVGIKPTLGLLSRSGIIPISGTLDTPGPMARTVRDAAILLGVMAGADPDDAATHTLRSDETIDYLAHLRKDGLSGMRIGINRAAPEDEPPPTEEEKTAFETLCKALRAGGAVLIDRVNISAPPGILHIMRYELKACMNHYLSTLRGSSKMTSLQDIVAFNQAHAPVALKYGQSLLNDSQNNTSGTMTEPEYLQALAEREKAIESLDRTFDAHGIDVMLCETFADIAPLAGFPSMSIPIGQRRDKLPIGSTWIARRFDEATMLRAAYAAESGLGLDLRPEFT